MGEQKSKQVVEWSFSFGDVGDSINKTLRDLGVDAEVKTSHFTEPIGAAKSARVRLDLATGKIVPVGRIGSGTQVRGLAMQSLFRMFFPLIDK